MKTAFSELTIGLGTALVSVLLVLGALLTSQAEVLPAPRIVAEATSTPPNLTPSATPAPGEPSATPVPSPSPTVPVPTDCPLPPSGWESYQTQPDDTLEQLAKTYQVTVDQIVRVNCMKVRVFKDGTNLYLPVLPTSTSTSTATVTASATRKPTSQNTPAPTDVPTITATLCKVAPPAGWSQYIIKQGDTLSSIAARFNVNVNYLARINCIFNPSDIKYGMPIWVPGNPTATPSPTAVTPTSTRSPATPTRTPSPTPTNTKGPTATHTPTPTPTNGVNPTSTHTPTSTPTNTLAPTATHTPTPIPTDTPEPTATHTPTPTDTPAQPPLKFPF